MRFPITLIGAVAARLIIGGLYPPIKRKADYTINASMPNVINEPLALVDLKKRGHIEDPYFYKTMAFQGLDKDRSDELYKLSERLLDISELTNLRLRGELTVEDYIIKADQIGMSAENAEKVYKLIEQRLDPLTIIKAFWRGLGIGKDAEAVKSELYDQGWTKERVETLLDVNKFYPSAQDLVTWQAKEVYEPDAIKKYGLEDELDRLEKEPFYKAGIDNEQIANYWKAHWQHPSWNEVREMLFRAGLNETDVWEWFRLVEIPPYWRDRMIKIMYRPFTRVDVRRMNKIGVLNDNETKQAYMDLGYDTDKAGKMLQFTLLYNADPEEGELTEADKARNELRGLTRSTTIKAYKQGRIEETTAKEYLTDLGYSGVVIDFYIAQTDYEIAEDKEEGYIKAYHRMFVNGIINSSQTTDLLDELDIPSRQREYLLDLWVMETAQKPAQPSKSELIKFTKKGFLTLDRFTEIMSGMGYAEEFINYYIKDNKLKSAN